MQFILHAEGRVVMTQAQPRYEYFLKDHLGNVRVTFTTQTETETFKATLDNPDEDAAFLNLDKIRKVLNPYFDHTHDATGGSGYALRLSGGPHEKYGLQKTLQLMPGDKVHMEVYAKYLTKAQQESYNYYIANLFELATGGLLNLGNAVVDV